MSDIKATGIFILFYISTCVTVIMGFLVIFGNPTYWYIPAMSGVIVIITFKKLINDS